MSKRIIIFFLSIVMSGSSFSQNQKDTLKPRHYVSLNQFKEIFSRDLTRLDSLNFIYKDNDTLVRIFEYERDHRKGVPYEFKDSTFLDFYKKVAFRLKADRISPKTKMKYWKDPIKIFFSKSIQKQTRKEFLKFTKEISETIDSLGISEVKKIEKSNYIIYYKGDFEYESRMHNYKDTNYYMYWNGKNQIYKCALRVDSKTNFNEKLRLYQLKSYFLISLGHFKLSNKFNCESYFSDCFSENKKFTTFDLELLRYHYSYGVCKGTDLDTFEKSHARIKKQYRKTGRYPLIIN